MRRASLALLAVPLFVAQCAPQQCAPAPPPPTTIEEAWTAFDRDLSAQLLGGGDDAVSVTVSVDGVPVHSVAYGRRLPWTDEPAEPTDRLRIASISKVVTATVVLQLVEAGYVGLDQAVGGAIARRAGAGVVDGRVHDITVRQLLSHTAGLGSWSSLLFGGTVGSCSAAARHVLSTWLGRTPGTTYTYANVGYCLLGLLVEELTGRDHEDVARDSLLAPLGLGGMRIAGTHDTRDGDVFHWSKPERNYMEVLDAAGAWLATSSDIVTILDALDPSTPGWHPLSPSTTALMRQGGPYAYSPGRWYGLGLICFADGSCGHTGTLESAHGVVLDRADGITWSILVSGEFPRETDDLIPMFDQVLAASGVLGFLR